MRQESGDPQGRLPGGGVSSSLAAAVLAAWAPAGLPLGMLRAQTPCSPLLLCHFHFLQPPSPFCALWDTLVMNSSSSHTNQRGNLFASKKPEWHTPLVLIMGWKRNSEPEELLKIKHNSKLQVKKLDTNLTGNQLKYKCKTTPK